MSPKLVVVRPRLPVVILVFVILGSCLHEATRTDKDGLSKGERDWVHEDVVMSALFANAARHAKPPIAHAILGGGR